MSIKATAGQILINRSLPKKLRDYSREINKKSLKTLLKKVATKYPTMYKDVLFGLKKVGQRVSYLKGSELKLEDFESPIDHLKILNEGIKKLPSNASDAKVTEVFSEIKSKIENKTFDAALKKNNLLAMHVASGARGNPSQLSSTISSPTLYADSSGKPIRVPIKHSFAEGLTSPEYFAGSYGTRRGVIATKFATPDGGYFGKQLGYVSGNLLVTEDDCGTNNGIDTYTDDSENIGRILAKSTAGFPANTILTPEILATIKKKKIKKIIIRSPISCESVHGVCKKCRGFNEKGLFPNLGDNVGTDSAAALSESATQGAMNVKHTGGQVTAAKKGGLELFKQLLKIPKTFRGGAVVSEQDGKIDNIERAPQGGFNISVNGQVHYSLPEFDPIVKKGDIIEAGMPLTKGIVNPADVTRLRGVGEGRKYLFESFRKGMLEDGAKVNKIHIESLAKSMLNFMRVKDDKFLDDSVPGDIVTLGNVAKYYKPQFKSMTPNKDTVGKYLAKPHMHLNPGTKLKPSMVNLLKDSGYKTIDVTDEEPPFDPVMIRLDDVPGANPNWLTRLFSTQLKKKIIGATQQSESAPIHGTSIIPSYITGKLQTDKIMY